MSLFNFDYQFVKYGSFHDQKVNQLIHFIFVPTILISALVWVSYTPHFYVWEYSHLIPINGAFAVASLYALYYLALWPLIGILALPYVFGCFYVAQEFSKSKVFGYDPIPASIAIHITSWVFQIIGHAVFEGRAPAFTKDPLQAIVLAPLFVFCEGLFALGLFPNTHKRLSKKVKEQIKKMDSVDLKKKK